MLVKTATDIREPYNTFYMGEIDKIFFTLPDLGGELLP